MTYWINIPSMLVVVACDALASYRSFLYSFGSGFALHNWLSAQLTQSLLSVDQSGQFFNATPSGASFTFMLLWTCGSCHQSVTPCRAK